MVDTIFKKMVYPFCLFNKYILVLIVSNALIPLEILSIIVNNSIIIEDIKVYILYSANNYCVPIYVPATFHLLI